MEPQPQALPAGEVGSWGRGACLAEAGVPGPGRTPPPPAGSSLALQLWPAAHPPVLGHMGALGAPSPWREPRQTRVDWTCPEELTSPLPAAPAPILAPLTARRRKKTQQLRETRRAQPGYGNHKGRPSPSQAGMLTWSPARVNCCSRHLARTGLVQEGVGCSGRLAG